MSDKTVSLTERLRRAQEQDIEYTPVYDTSDLTVVEAENHDSDRDNVYTLVPDILYCGCADDRYRGPVCKHLLGLAINKQPGGTKVVEKLDEYRYSNREMAEELRESLHQAIERADEASTVLDELKESQDEPDTLDEAVEEEAMELVEEMEEEDESELTEVDEVDSPDGVIAFWNNVGQYGFIESDNWDEDVFFHLDDVDIDPSVVAEGVSVDFDAIEAGSGPKVTAMREHQPADAESESEEEEDESEEEGLGSLVDALTE